MNQLESLKSFSTVVVDSGDIQFIRKYLPEDVTTNPTLIRQIINLPEYQDIIINSVIYAKKQGGNNYNKIINAVDKISVNLGTEILKVIPGKISTEIDARLSFNTDLCIRKAKRIISMYEEQGISRSRILIKLAATWECICAAKELKKENIQSNLTLLFSFAQARACAEAGVYLISPFVGRIFDWYKDRFNIGSDLSDNDPGVKSVRKIYYYYKQYNFNTVIMGASFRNIGQILALSGCDRLTISPTLLRQLQLSKASVTRKLYPPTVKKQIDSYLSKSDFYWLHNEDPMAVEKLSEGIRQFGSDQIALETMIFNHI